MGVVTPLPQNRYKFRRAVRAKDDGRLNPLDAFDKLVKVRVIGKRDGVIDAEPPSPGGINGPSGDADRDRPAKTGKCCRLLSPGARNYYSIQRRGTIA